MTFRERLLALLRAPSYSPGNEFEIARRLNLKKKERGQLAHEVRAVLRSGEFARGGNGRIGPINTGEPRPPKTRAVFQPTRRGSASLPALSSVEKTSSTKKQSRAGNLRPKEKSDLTPRRPSAKSASRSAREKAPAAAPSQKNLPLESGEFVGKIQFRQGGSAFVLPAEKTDFDSAQIFPEDTGVALPGDQVVVKIIPHKRARRAGEKIGKVVRVVERARESIVGNLRRGRRELVVQPDDPRFSYEILVGSLDDSEVQPLPEEGDKVVVQLEEWSDRRDPLRGTVIRRLGRTHEPQAEMLGLFEKYELDRKFPSDVEQQALAIPTAVSARERQGRLDYRERAVFTIDPDDAKDFDDALSYEKLDDGSIRIGVHIADVSAYVLPQTPLDMEAQRRGNSTYLVGLVVPMLPEKLSNGLCSLVEGEDRLCKAVFFLYRNNSLNADVSFANTVIRSRKRLTYKQAYTLLFNDDLAKIRALPLPPKHQTGSTGRALDSLSDSELRELQGWVRALWKIAEKLRRDRMRHGSLDLDMPETKIFVDERGYADRLEKISHDESHQLIEEFMLAANEAVARLTREEKLASLYRVHDEPDAEKLDEYRNLLGTFGITSGDLTKRENVVGLLSTLQTHPQGYTLRTQLLRSLKKAAYRETADGHFGLHKNDYTHFTSPIRRYADLVVHRVIGDYLARDAGGAAGNVRRSHYDNTAIHRLGEHLSLTEINSSEAERESVKIKLLEFFERELPKADKTHFAAIITDVRPNGFFVELVDSLTFGFVPEGALQGDDFRLDAAGENFVGRKTKRIFGANTRLDVTVMKVDRYKRLIDFQPA